MAEREVKQWITVNGKHVPIYEGESKADAIKRATDKQINDDADKKEKQIAENKKKADKLNGKQDSKEGTSGDLNKLKQQIDDYVKAHPNPSAEDRAKVSAMRDKYNEMKAASWKKTKEKVKAKLAAEEDTSTKKQSQTKKSNKSSSGGLSTFDIERAVIKEYNLASEDSDRAQRIMNKLSYAEAEKLVKKHIKK